jgi:hypothetical protein
MLASHDSEIVIYGEDVRMWKEPVLVYWEVVAQTRRGV